MSDNSEFKKLEAVKELIFGSEINNFKQQFEAIELEINKLNTKIDELKKDISTETSLIKKNVEKNASNTDLRLEKIIATKQDTNKLGQLITKLGQKLTEESK